MFFDKDGELEQVDTSGAEPSEDMKTSKDPAILKKYKAETEEEKNEIKEIKRFMKRGSNLSEAIRAREAFYTNNPSEYKNEAGQAALSNIKTVFGVDIQKNSASNGARQTPEELREIGTKGAESGKGAEADNKAAREAVHEMNMKSKEAAANRAYERRQKEHDPDYKPEGKKALKLPDEKSSFQTDVNRMKKLKQQDYKQYTIQLEKLHSKYPINKWTALYDKTTRDSAPLTGDCKIRVRKS